MTTLSVHAQIVRIYAAAIRQSFGPMLLEADVPTAQLARLLLGLADSTADCAEAIGESQRELEALAREIGVRPPPAKLRVIEGGLR